jgi:anti-anti-sigma factor
MRVDPEAVRRTRECFGGAVVITLADPAASAAGEQLLRLADERGWDEVCLDLGELPHLTSSWLVTLLALNRRVRNRGGHLRLVNVAAPAYEVFRESHLHTVLDVRPAGQVLPPPPSRRTRRGARGQGGAVPPPPSLRLHPLAEAGHP